MVIISSSLDEASASTSPLLYRDKDDDRVLGMVDYKGRPVHRSSSGGWKSAIFIIGLEVVERFAFYGMSLNLINYLTGPMGQSTAAAAENINIWGGVCAMLPLLGAFLADSYLGRYWTIFFSSLVYILGLGMIVLSSSLPFLFPAACSAPSCHPEPTTFQVAFLFSALYLVAFAGGGFKPSTQALGADQFDPLDPAESEAKSSFFNWWYFGICAGTFLSLSTVIYVQDNLSWGLGFVIPCAAMAGGFFLFLLGSGTYRITPIESGTGINIDHYSSLAQVIPIWATCVAYGVVFAQSQTFFTKQGSTLDRRIGSHFLIPSASVQILISFTIITLLPVYDRIFVPAARYFTGVPSGITSLQRIGIGMALSIMAMIVAATVEARRLGVAVDAGLVEEPELTLPMSLWWLVPQYVLYGMSDVFAVVGFQEFFYSEVPAGMRSLGVALYLSIFGVGSFVSGALIVVTDKASGGAWFSSNLNKAHLHYFYLLLAALTMLSMATFVYLAKSYTSTFARPKIESDH